MKRLDKVRYKRIIIFLIIGGFFALFAIAFDLLMMFTNNQYTAFIYHFFTLLFIAGMTAMICLFFLYMGGVIFFFNPKKIKNSTRFIYGLVSLIAIILLIVTLALTFRTTIATLNDINDYKIGNWEMEDVIIEKIYWGDTSRNALITTSIGEFTLPKKAFHLKIGKEYQITYLKHTKTIIHVNN